MLPSAWRASLVAWDGATILDLPQQVRRMPPDASHVALSIGGNDVLGHVDLLATAVSSTAEALDLFSRRVSGFESAYRSALATVVSLGLPTIVCTIYNGALRDPDEARRAKLALALFNDAILRSAWEHGCAILELRRVCTDLADYANPIEPSGQGGAKIARAVARGIGAVAEPEHALYSPHRSRV